MSLHSDNCSGASPAVMAALLQANQGAAQSYGDDAIMDVVRAQIRTTFEAPEAAVYLVATGTAANSLAMSISCPPWGAVFAHRNAHVIIDECGAPEFFTNGARLIPVEGDAGKITPETLAEALMRIVQGDVHSVQRGMLTLTNVTEAGTVYTAAEVAALTAAARALNMPSHMDGARFANAIVATNASPAQMTWRAGVDVLSFGGTKNGCLGVEAVVIFDPAKAWEFELRRKRGGHLFSKHRYLSAQMLAYLADDHWLQNARNANRTAADLATGLGKIGVALRNPAQANILFPLWPASRAQHPGAALMEDRLITSWNTTPADISTYLAAVSA